MSDANSPQLVNDEWDDILRLLNQPQSDRELVSAALKQANAAFAAQFLEPDPFKYMQACDELTKFLQRRILLEYSEQKLLVQILQIASAMHENAVNNSALTRAQLSGHQIASTSLHCLCKSAFELSGVTYVEPMFEAFSLGCRAEAALANATRALDISMYIDFEKMADDYWGASCSNANETSAASSFLPPILEPTTPRASMHDIADVRQSPRSGELKEKALEMLRDQPPKGAPLTRAHTMPPLSQLPSFRSPRASREPPRAHSRGHGLHTLQESEE